MTALALILLLGPSSLAADASIEVALQIISSAPAGRSLIKNAAKFWKLKDSTQVSQHFRWSNVSRTDAVITRHLDAESGQEVREREVTIYIKRNTSMNDLVLDISHELVHATTRPDWDPYDPGLSPGRYIALAIEGTGGEVDAVYTECQVSRELASLKTSFDKRCKGYLSASTHQLEKELIKKDFYKVGRSYNEFIKALGGETVALTALSSEDATLYSSTGHAPYPVALLKEYTELNLVACNNSRKRAEVFLSRTKLEKGRSLASVGAQPTLTERMTDEFLNQRCRSRSF